MRMPYHRTSTTKAEGFNAQLRTTARLRARSRNSTDALRRRRPLRRSPAPSAVADRCISKNRLTLAEIYDSDPQKQIWERIRSRYYMRLRRTAGQKYRIYLQWIRIVNPSQNRTYFRNFPKTTTDRHRQYGDPVIRRSRSPTVRRSCNPPAGKKTGGTTAAGVRIDIQRSSAAFRLRATRHPRARNG